MDPVTLPGIDTETLSGYISVLIALLGTVATAAFTLKIGEKSVGVVKRLIGKF